MAEQPSKKEFASFSLQEADASIRRGNEAVKESRYEDAYWAWKEALEIDPTRRQMVEKRLMTLRARLVAPALQEARAAAQAGRHREAAQLYRKVLGFEPDDVPSRVEAREGLDRSERIDRMGRRARVLAEGGAVLAGIVLFAYFVYRILQ